MILVLFLLLLATCAVALWHGTGTSDGSSEKAQPDLSVYPPVGIH